ncbi:MAG: type II secretory pathway pseudopilin PulG [Lentimonas sp.]|jgi:type II secretory pathway pseudopilin PulG
MIELLCVIALIGAISSWILYNHTPMGDALTRLSIEEVFRNSVKEARYLARSQNKTVYLSWDLESQGFRFDDDQGELEVPAKHTGQDRLSLPESLEIYFEAAHPKQGDPDAAYQSEMDPTSRQPLRLAFYSNGVGDTGHIEFESASNPSRTLSLDAFSSGALPQQASSE